MFIFVVNPIYFMISRRSFLQSSILLAGSTLVKPLFEEEFNIMTINGSIGRREMGHTLVHEHILVDFIGAKDYDPDRWNRKEVIDKVLPFLKELKAVGCKTVVDCTPNYLGRDVTLLQQLSQLSGLQILTNTGYYGGSDNKFLPSHAFTETDVQLATRWIKEAQQGIDGTAVRPGFIKISVNDDSLTEISKKLIRAAAYCHSETGLTIASHTGPAKPAFEQIEILRQMGVAADAFIWVHAQTEKDRHQYLKAAKYGAWISLDGLNENNVSEYVPILAFLKKEKHLRRILVSHDAGWYEPGKPGGGNFRGYTTLFHKLIPALKQAHFSQRDIDQIIQHNPAEVFSIKKRKR
jgi:phosphotriesterase-related protein